MARGKQERLPGTHNGIPEIEQVGFELAAIRDKRIQLTKDESGVQEKALTAMKKNNLMTYNYGGLVLIRVPGKEKVQVRKNKTEEGDPE